MSNHLAGFLIELGENPQRLQDFRDNPRRAMRRAGLSTAERRAIASGDGMHIRHALTPDDPYRPVWVQEIVIGNVRPSV